MAAPRDSTTGSWNRELERGSARHPRLDWILDRETSRLGPRRPSERRKGRGFARDDAATSR
eukprot:6816389-Pyramimonas_sp.AAC.1